jgi:hypothetical protein
MARTEGRTGPHIQPARPASGGRTPPAPPVPEDPPAVEETRRSGWRFAAMIWAIVFLFLGALLVFDLIAGLLHS